MAHGVVVPYYATLTTGSTLTSFLDISTRSWDKVYLQVPSMASGSDFYIQGSIDRVTYSRIMHPILNSTIAFANTFTISSLSTNRIVLIPNGIRYIKIEASTALTNSAVQFNLICSD
jgi:hypothetical protein